MSLLSAADLADLYALDASAMPDTATITTVTQVDDGGGSYTTPDTSATSPCRLVAASGDEAGEDQVRERGSYRLYLPRATTIAATSTVTVAGRTFHVVWTPPVTTYSTSRVVGLEDA
jgi:hypothetical protein